MLKSNFLQFNPLRPLKLPTYLRMKVHFHNIFTNIYTDSFLRTNPDLNTSDHKRVLENVSLTLYNDDLGEASLLTNYGTKFH